MKDMDSSAMRILIVSNGFYPEISPRSFRATELAIEFARQGHQVTVISKRRDHDYSDFLSKNGVELKMWQKQRFPTFPTTRLGAVNSLSQKVSRIMKILFEYPVIEDMFEVRKMLQFERGYDLMISIAVPYPIHWGVAWAIKRNKSIAYKWVADCGDPYMGDVLDTFRKPFYFRFLEKGFCRKADFITIPIESAKTGYYPEFREKIRVIPQGFQFDLDSELQIPPNNTIPTFAYAGGFIPGKRDPIALLEYLAKIEIPFRFVVFTNMPEIIHPFQEVLKSKLEILKYVSRQELLERLSEMDFVINLDNNTERNVPSKLIDYAILNKPVLNISKDFSPEQVSEFLTGNYQSRMVLPNREYYHITKVANQFQDLVS